MFAMQLRHWLLLLLLLLVLGQVTSGQGALQQTWCSS
jgi:hypothetical protein